MYNVEINFAKLGALADSTGDKHVIEATENIYLNDELNKSLLHYDSLLDNNKKNLSNIYNTLFDVKQIYFLVEKSGNRIILFNVFAFTKFPDSNRNYDRKEIFFLTPQQNDVTSEIANYFINEHEVVVIKEINKRKKVLKPDLLPPKLGNNSIPVLLGTFAKALDENRTLILSKYDVANVLSLLNFLPDIYKKFIQFGINLSNNDSLINEYLHFYTSVNELDSVKQDNSLSEYSKIFDKSLDYLLNEIPEVVFSPIAPEVSSKFMLYNLFKVHKSIYELPHLLQLTPEKDNNYKNLLDKCIEFNKSGLANYIFENLEKKAKSEKDRVSLLSTLLDKYEYSKLNNFKIGISINYLWTKKTTEKENGYKDINTLKQLLNFVDHLFTEQARSKKSTQQFVQDRCLPYINDFKRGALKDKGVLCSLKDLNTLKEIYKTDEKELHLIEQLIVKKKLSENDITLILSNHNTFSDAFLGKIMDYTEVGDLIFIVNKNESLLKVKCILTKFEIEFQNLIDNKNKLSDFAYKLVVDNLNEENKSRYSEILLSKISNNETSFKTKIQEINDEYLFKGKENYFIGKLNASYLDNSSLSKKDFILFLKNLDFTNDNLDLKQPIKNKCIDLLNNNENFDEFTDFLKEILITHQTIRQIINDDNIFINKVLSDFKSKKEYSYSFTSLKFLHNSIYKFYGLPNLINLINDIINHARLFTNNKNLNKLNLFRVLDKKYQAIIIALLSLLVVSTCLNIYLVVTNNKMQDTSKNENVSTPLKKIIKVSPLLDSNLNFTFVNNSFNILDSLKRDTITFNLNQKKGWKLKDTILLKFEILK